ncbi:MAG: gas vesicle protein [Candidatus Marinimicrobia bacterium]|nr:gas vesicle protein [Candidatus Neomarinimicrobiota bacterium]
MENYSLERKRINLSEVLDRVLTKGVVISGELWISVADIDLIYLQLRVLLSSVETALKMKHGLKESIEEIN